MANNKKKPGSPQTSKKPVITPQSTTVPKATATPTNASPRATKERREERKQQERKQRNILIFVGVVIFVGILAAILLVVNSPQDAPVPDGIDTRYVGIPQTYSIENGMPMLGSPGAPVQVVSYTSFACPSCKDFHNAMTDTMIGLIKEGIMSYTIIPQENGEIPNGNGAARGALCAAEQGKFFEYGDVLFSWQELFGNQAFGQNRMFTGADELGLDGGAFRSCIASGRVFDLYNRADNLRLQRNITGTPRTFINGIEYTGGLTDRNAFNSTVQQTYQQSGRIAVPLATETPAEDVAVPEVVVPETTPEMTPEATEEVIVPETTPEATPEN
ncbi:MAG: thioredoxin domain-containing protein [Phototrophicales bacterium]|nr:thioredoxin domain-containing protein [Phototrophicales bacterium]